MRLPFALFGGSRDPARVFPPGAGSNVGPRDDRSRTFRATLGGSSASPSSPPPRVWSASRGAGRALASGRSPAPRVRARLSRDRAGRRRDGRGAVSSSSSSSSSRTSRPFRGGAFSSSSSTRGAAMSSALIPGAPLMAQSLGGAFVIDMGIQFVGWAFASALRTEKFYDLCGSLAFASTALATFASGAREPRQALLTGMVCAWTGRLGIFLLARVLRDGGDSRFDEVKTKPGMFAIYWALQGVWVWVTALPCFLINGASNQSALHAGDYVAFAVWLVGVVTETVADWQKRRFKSDPANAGRFIDVGLWSLSRHPNYFGEIVTWFGAAGVALAANVSPAVSCAAMCSPVFVTFLLTQMSGVPILEKSADERWGNEAKYQEYKRLVPVLVPRLPGFKPK